MSFTKTIAVVRGRATSLSVTGYNKQRTMAEEDISLMRVLSRESHDDVPPRSLHDEEHSHTSDEEYQHALEVVFDPQNSHRRKSSLVTAEAPARRLRRDKSTACFVHALLESQRKRGEYQGSLDGINETLRLSGDKAAKTEERPDQDHIGDPKGGDANSDSSRKQVSFLFDGRDHGEPDEVAWRNQHPKILEEDPTLMHSRLLTKKQLSDMAWGVRELSKRLGSIRLKLKVKTVFILTKAHDETLIEKTREVARWLLSEERQVRYIVYVEENLKNNKKFGAEGLLKELEEQQKNSRSAVANGDSPAGQGNAKVERRLRYWANDMCRTRPHTFDFVVTLGGDGTVLYASWLFQRIVPPVLSFALGSLGFLTKFDYENFRETLTSAFRDGVLVSLRLRFEGTVMRSQKRKKKPKRLVDGDNAGDGRTPSSEEEVPRDLVEELIGEEKDDEYSHKPDGTYEILNDIVVDRGPNPTMSSIEIFGDDEHFTTVQADGICVATPTGSTAYNLAAGGSLCHPENPVILVSAICAHTLSFRPIILPDTIVLRIGVPYDARTNSWASFDGRERVELRAGDYVTIAASRYPFANVMPQGRRSEDWVNSICGKLGWNTRQRQKSYKEWQ